MEHLKPGIEEAIEQLFKGAESKAKLSTIKEIAHLQGLDLPSIRNLKKETLLHVAAGYGRISLADYLIDQKADVNARDSEGQVPLHYACNHAHKTIAQKLIDAGAQVNLTDTRGWSSLHFALSRKENAEKVSLPYWEVVNLLLNSGADPYIKSKSGRNCLNRIGDSDQRRCVRTAHLLHQLKHCNSGDAIDLIDKHMSVRDFFEHVKGGDVELLRVLLTPRLLHSRLKDFDNITPLHRAAGYNHIEVAKFFISENADVNASDGLGRLPLHNAAQYGHIDMIELLVMKGSDINGQDQSGLSPLHVAASNKTFIACLKLIELGANIYLRTHNGELPYDLAESDDVREVLRPEVLRHRIEMIPSSSDQAIYIGMDEDTTEPQRDLIRNSQLDKLMLDSNSSNRLFTNTNYVIKQVTLNQDDWRYQTVKKRMFDTIRIHNNESGGFYSGYEIISIELILHEKVWSKYRLMCQRLEIDYGNGSKNEKLLFHGSNFIDKIQSHGFDERYAQRNGMFGAGIYFAAHSSKSNQYTFGWDQGCSEHKDKSCYICERKMIYAQVALGKSLESVEAMPECAHAPPGYTSVSGLPLKTDELMYPEYVIYSGDQAYPLFVIRYRITPPRAL